MMATRMDVSDVALLGGSAVRSRAGTICSIAIIARPTNWDLGTLMEFVDSRLAAAPRYRQKIRNVPFGIGRAVWVDDPDFDLSFHVRRSALPAPGGLRQLAELVARIVDRPLEYNRPLWELYLIEGFAEGKIAVFSKTHQALVDGRDYLDLTQIVLTNEPVSMSEVEVATWTPSATPSNGVLVVDALTSLITDPLEPLHRIGSSLHRAEKSVRSVLNALTSPLRPTSVTEAGSFQIRRASGTRVGFASFPLSDLSGIARRQGCTVNDVVLTVLCGALRAWIQSWGRPLATSDVINVMVPLAVRAGKDDRGRRTTTTFPALLGSDSIDTDTDAKDPSGVHETVMASAVLPLPVGEPNPRVRLAQIARETVTYTSTGKSVSARTMASFGEFAPATLHALGARAARLVPEGEFDLVVTNAPGPQHTMYWGEGQMFEMYPVPVLLPGQGLSVAMTSYDGTVFCGFTSDRSVVPDVDEIGELIASAIEELQDVDPYHAKPRAGERT